MLIGRGKEKINSMMRLKTRKKRSSAPIGPGVYEVRHAETGELIAFGDAANVATAIADLKVDHGGGWLRFFRADNPRPDVANLEYRTYAAASRADARSASRKE